jgi:hypothetical protein
MESEFEVPPSASEKSENVKVAVRIRPMSESEVARGDQVCLNAENENTLSISQKFAFRYSEGPRRAISSTMS